MRHAIAGYKLGRDTEHRTALFRNLAAGLIQHGQITTTRPKAKAVQPFVEKLISLARKGDLASRRRAIAKLQDRDLVASVDEHGEPEFEDKTLIQKLFDDLGPRYAERPGGYTRIVALSKHRIGDGGDLVVLQLVGDEDKHKHTSSSRRRKKQDNRAAFAAKARKAADKPEKPADQPEASDEAEPEAPEQAPAEEQAAEDSPRTDPRPSQHPCTRCPVIRADCGAFSWLRSSQPVHGWLP